MEQEGEVKRTVKAWAWIRKDLSVYEYLFKTKKAASLWSKRSGNDTKGQVVRLIFTYDDGKKGKK